MDSRVQKLAQILIHHSLGIQPGNTLRLRGSVAALPLLQAAYYEALKAGALIIARLDHDSFQEMLLRDGTPEQLAFVNPLLTQEIETIETWLDVQAETNTRQFSSIDPERMAVYAKALGPAQELFQQRASTGANRAVYTIYPTEAYAQEANMSLREYEDFVFNAGLLFEDDPVAAWARVEREQQRSVDFLNHCKHVRIVAEDTDLEYRCAGRNWVNGAGKVNFPDGEVFTGPIEDSVRGTIRFPYAFLYEGHEIEDARFLFEDGRVVAATATKGQAVLDAMINLDAGARYVGEVAFGLNYGIQRFTGNPLFDEKIGGTMHLALGLSYPETGGKNISALHYDLVCDLRKGGEVYIDGESFYQDGRFLF
ncbi:MAG TPA: aminopeptidase [Sphingobacteriaceae bacterium]